MMLEGHVQGEKGFVQIQQLPKVEVAHQLLAGQRECRS